MYRSYRIDGVMVSFKRSILGWIACFGPERWVSFTQCGSVWVARRRFAGEPICTASSLAGAVRLTKRRFDAEDREIEQSVTSRLRAALAERDSTRTSNCY
jgi:hypothetical protein